MEFLKAVLRDNLIYTIPFIVARTVIYPIVNVNSKLQRTYRKIEEEADVKDKYQKYQNFSFKEKIQCAKDIIAVAGYRGLFEKYENYIVPFIMARWFEGLVYFVFMRFCLDVLQLDDPLYLLTGLSFFFVNMVGAFCLKIFADIMRERKGWKASLAYMSPSNKTFWKQYEIELGYYHAYGLVQGYFQLFTFWYLRPGLKMEIFLFTLSRLLAGCNCQPLGILATWAYDSDYDYVKLFNQISKKDGRRGLYAGVRDMFFNELIFSPLLVLGFHATAALI